MELENPDVVEPTFALTSVQKVHQLLGQVGQVKVSGTDAMLLSAFTMALPMLQGRIPSDPVELDGLLDRACAFLGSLRSDPGAIA